MSRRFVLAGAVALALAAVPGVAQAAGTHSLDGSCDITQGTAAFDNPITGIPTTTGYSFTGTGTCTGSIDGGPSETLPMRASIRQPSATLSCAFSGSMGGNGTLDLLDSAGNTVASVAFTLDEISVGTEVPVRASGATSGTALGEANFREAGTDPNTLMACGPTGNGLESLPFTATIMTVGGPLVG